MHTDIEKGTKVVVLSLVDTSLLKQSQNSSIAKSRFVDLSRISQDRIVQTQISTYKEQQVDS